MTHRLVRRNLIYDSDEGPVPVLSFDTVDGDGNIVVDSAGPVLDAREVTAQQWRAVLADFNTRRAAKIAGVSAELEITDAASVPLSEDPADPPPPEEPDAKEER